MPPGAVPRPPRVAGGGAAGGLGLSAGMSAAGSGSAGRGGGGPDGVAAKAGLAVQLLGAAMSLALLAGGAVWGYKLIVRDATGVPVVRAMEGPMRQAPGDPGGTIALNTGLSVNAVAAVGEAAPPEDVLVLAPPTPDLTVEDLLFAPTAEADEVLAEDLQPGGGITLQTDNSNEVAAGAAPPPLDAPLSAEDILALADAISAGATPLAPLAEAPFGAEAADAPEAVGGGGAEAGLDIGTAAGTEAAAEAGTETGTETGTEAATDVTDPSADAAALFVAAAVAEAAGAAEEAAPVAAVDAEGRLLRALRPTSRPDGLSAAGAVTPEPSEAQTLAVSSAEVPLGTTLVQLGAFDSPDLAGAEWTRLGQRFAAFMEGKDPLVQEAESGGRAFFRLRATGFADIADARRFCSTLVAEGAACIPVVIQ